MGNASLDQESEENVQEFEKKEKESNPEEFSSIPSKLVGHSKSVICIIYFPLCERLVSCSFDKCVKIWDISNGKCVKTLRMGFRLKGVRHLIPYNDTDFISCTDDGRIVQRSALDYSYTLLHTSSGKAFDNEFSIRRLLKLSNGMIAFTTQFPKMSRSSIILSTISILNVEKQRVIKVLKHVHIDRRTKLVKSEIQKTSFYYNSFDSDTYNPIQLFDFERNEITKVFIGHENEQCYSLATALNSRNEELLIVAGSNIFIYNTTSKYQKTLFTKYIHKISDINTDYNHRIYSILPIGIKYLFIANSNGELSLLKEYNTKNHRPIFHHKKIHEKGIFDVLCIKNLPISIRKQEEDSEKYSLVVTCSIDGLIRINKLKKLKRKSEIVNNEIQEMVDIENYNNNSVNYKEQARLFDLTVVDLEKIRVCGNLEFLSERKKNENEILRWLYFPVHKILILKLNNQRIVSLSMKNKTKVRNEGKEEEEGEEEEEDDDDYKSFKMVTSIDNIHGEEKFREIRRWNDNTFLGIDVHGTIRFYSIHTLQQVYKNFEFEYEGRKITTNPFYFILVRLLIPNSHSHGKEKDDEHYFILSMNANNIQDGNEYPSFLWICNPESSKIVKELYPSVVIAVQRESIYYPSKKYPNTFYRSMNCGEKWESSDYFYNNNVNCFCGCEVEMIDYEHEIIIGSFSDEEEMMRMDKSNPRFFLHNKKKKICSLNSYISRTGEEILLVGTYRTIYFFRVTKQPEKTTYSLDDDNNEGNNNMKKRRILSSKSFKKITVEENKGSYNHFNRFSYVLMNQILFLGSSGGHLYFLDLHRNSMEKSNVIYDTRVQGLSNPSDNLQICSENNDLLPLKIPCEIEYVETICNDQRKKNKCLKMGTIPRFSKRFVVFDFCWDFQENLCMDRLVGNEMERKDEFERSLFVVEYVMEKETCMDIVNRIQVGVNYLFVYKSFFM